MYQPHLYISKWYAVPFLLNATMVFGPHGLNRHCVLFTVHAPVTITPTHPYSWQIGSVIGCQQISQFLICLLEADRSNATSLWNNASGQV